MNSISKSYVLYFCNSFLHFVCPELINVFFSLLLIQCSIDGLLGRTIKHMQFLTSVSDQADKIGQHIVKTVNPITL